MREKEFQEWGDNCKKEVATQIILNRLYKKKKVTLKQKKEIQKKIDTIGYKNFLDSPHLEGKEELKKKAIMLCIEDYYKKNKSSPNTSKENPQ